MCIIVTLQRLTAVVSVLNRQQWRLCLERSLGVPLCWQALKGLTLLHHAALYFKKKGILKVSVTHLQPSLHIDTVCSKIWCHGGQIIISKGRFFLFCTNKYKMLIAAFSQSWVVGIKVIGTKLLIIRSMNSRINELENFQITGCAVSIPHTQCWSLVALSYLQHCAKPLISLFFVRKMGNKCSDLMNCVQTHIEMSLYSSNKL